MPAIATSWGATEAERAVSYGCDALLPDAPGRWFRAIDVAAPPPVLFRRVCQLRAAPYSYDLLDNFGRRSPRDLLPWCWSLEVGQPVMTIFTLDSFVTDRELTIRMKPGRPVRLFGDIALTYRLHTASGGSRLVAVLRVSDPPGPFAALRRRALAFGDLLMMRKQLQTLAELAAEDTRR